MPTDNKQVYILDDDGSVCRALSILLGTYGFTVDTFTSTNEFISAVPRGAPGCLILDIHMPGFDGWETLQHFLISGYSRPVVMISVDKNERLDELAFKLGAVGLLQKPIDTHELVNLIKIALKKKSSLATQRKRLA